MNTATETPIAVHPPALVSSEVAREWIDVLPLRAGKRIALTWQPHSSDFEHGEGFVILTSGKDRTAYAVCQYPGESALLGFVFTKVGGKGTDKDRESYVLTCCRSGSEAKCDCRGWQRWGWCKHADALETLFLNKWLS